MNAIGECIIRTSYVKSNFVNDLSFMAKRSNLFTHSLNASYSLSPFICLECSAWHSNTCFVVHIWLTQFWLRFFFFWKRITMSGADAQIARQQMVENLMGDDEVLCAFCAKAASKKCGRCGEFYCSLECQLGDWRNHRFICFPLP